MADYRFGFFGGKNGLTLLVVKNDCFNEKEVLDIGCFDVPGGGGQGAGVYYQ